MRSATDVRENLQSALGTAYLVEQELGGGGMSRVFVARDVALDRQVVVKLLPPGYGSGAAAEAFRREIQVAARLQHPHIVPILSAGETNGVPYYTMPFVEGESLRLRLARHSRTSIGEVLRILHDVIDALAYAHARGVVHRDIKPDNVLMSGSHAMITDFGVAKALHAASSWTTDGESGFAIGTPAYMAPEQAAADPHTDHRADLYAFGVLAYELLANRPPFSGRSALGLMAAQVTERPAHIGDLRYDVPPALADIIMACLEKNPDERPQSAARIREMLEAIAFANSSLIMPRRASSVWQHGSRVAAAVIAFLAGMTGFAVLGGADRGQSTLALAPVAANAPAPFAMHGSGAARLAHEIARAHEVGATTPTLPAKARQAPERQQRDSHTTPAANSRLTPSVERTAPVPRTAPAPEAAAPKPVPAPVPAQPRPGPRVVLSHPASAPEALERMGIDTGTVMRQIQQAMTTVRDTVMRYVVPGSVNTITRAVMGLPPADCPEKGKAGTATPAASAVTSDANAAQRLVIANVGAEALRELSRVRVEGVGTMEMQQQAVELRREAERLRAAELAEIERLLH